MYSNIHKQTDLVKYECLNFKLQCVDVNLCVSVLVWIYISVTDSEKWQGQCCIECVNYQNPFLFSPNILTG